ncbi:MAG: hypothetical protein GY850_31780 [bacterium]|nr:hypothetical protein [bacterium]
MKITDKIKWFPVVAALVLLFASCLADRPLTGVAVINESGRQILVSVEYKTAEEQFTIPDQNTKLVLYDYADGGSRSPQLRNDFILIEITDNNGIKTSYNRDQFLKKAHWDRKSRQWLLTIRPESSKPQE